MRTLDDYKVSLEGEALAHFSHVNISQQCDGHHFFDVGVPVSALRDFQNKLGKIIKVQYRETDYQFLSRLAARFGEWFFYNGAGLYFGEMPSTSETELYLGKNLFQAVLPVRMAPTQFRLLSYDYRKSERYDALASAAAVDGAHSYSKTALRVSDRMMKNNDATSALPDFTEKPDLEEWVRTRKAAMVNALLTLSGSSDAPDLKVGKLVKIAGAGEQDGKYLVMAVSHSMDCNGHYENHFEAIPAGVTAPPQNPSVREPVCETQTAVVTDNSDPDKLGRVRVRFVWQKAPGQSPWIRVVSLHSGADKGAYFVPEIDDEALVGFENDHPERPFVVGSLYHKKAAPYKWQDGDNNKKAFKTKSGNQIYFSDESGKEEIRIFNKDKANEIMLTLEGPGKIAIKAKDTLELSAKKIVLNADQEFSVKTNGEAKIEAVNTSLKSSGKLEVDGGSLAEVKAGLIKLN